jgi:cytochrome b561
LEKALLLMLFVTPGTGLLLIATGSDDWLPAHIGAQLLLLALIAVHVGLVLKHTVVHRDGHLRRMV